jgi:TRAP-type C4-dicarboxylate transport system substrate-binding protein
MKTRRKIKWLIAHRPEYLFFRTAEAFSHELEKLCPGEFEIEILTPTDYYKKYKDVEEFSWRPAATSGIEERTDDLPQDFPYKYVEWSDIKKKWTAMFDALKEDKFQMSQTQVTIIGGSLHSDFSVLDLPFLFKDHDHVSKVLDNEIGEEFCEKLIEKDIHGLAFTYSGGYRIIGSNQEIPDIESLKNVNIVTTPNTKAFFTELGASATARTEMKISDISESTKQGAAVETTYLRFSGSNILKTNHSMFLTTILTGSKFFNSLTESQKLAFKKAAKIVAKMERRWSLEDAEKYEQEAKSKGIKIIDLDDSDKEKLKNAAPIQHKWSQYARKYPKNLIEKIKNTN